MQKIKETEKTSSPQRRPAGVLSPAAIMITDTVRKIHSHTDQRTGIIFYTGSRETGIFPPDTDIMPYREYNFRYFCRKCAKK